MADFVWDSDDGWVECKPNQRWLDSFQRKKIDRKPSDLVRVKLVLQDEDRWEKDFGIPSQRRNQLLWRHRKAIKQIVKLPFFRTLYL